MNLYLYLHKMHNVFECCVSLKSSEHISLQWPTDWVRFGVCICSQGNPNAKLLGSFKPTRPTLHPPTHPHSLPQHSTEGDSQLTLLSWNSQVYVPKILEIIRRKPPLFQIVFGLVFKWLLLSWFGICNASRFWGPFLHLYCLPFLLQMSQNTFQLKLTGNTQSDGPLFTCHAPL